MNMICLIWCIIDAKLCVTGRMKIMVRALTWSRIETVALRKNTAGRAEGSRGEIILLQSDMAGSLSEEQCIGFQRQSHRDQNEMVRKWGKHWGRGYWQAGCQEEELVNEWACVRLEIQKHKVWWAQMSRISQQQSFINSINSTKKAQTLHKDYTFLPSVTFCLYVPKKKFPDLFFVFFQMSRSI